MLELNLDGILIEITRMSFQDYKIEETNQTNRLGGFEEKMDGFTNHFPNLGIVKIEQKLLNPADERNFGIDYINS